MRNVNLNSSAISSVNYDDTETLQVTFRSGHIYEFYSVPQNVVENLLSSESAGRFFVNNINGRFTSRRVG